MGTATAATASTAAASTAAPPISTAASTATTAAFIQPAAQISNSVAAPPAEASDPAAAAAVRARAAAVRPQRGVRTVRGRARCSHGTGGAAGARVGRSVWLLSGAAGPRRPEGAGANLCRPWEDAAEQGQETSASPSEESGHAAEQPCYLAILRPLWHLS